MHPTKSPQVKVVCIVAFLLAWLALPCLARATDRPSDADIQEILRKFIERDGWGVGIVVGIVDEHGSRIISYGKVAHGDGPLVNGDTLFEVGSITKTFTALLLLDMVNRGFMRLDDPIGRFLPPGVTAPEWHGKKITLAHLATHTSGLPRDLEGDWKVARLYDLLSHHKLRRQPGSKTEYSNLGFALLAHLIELKAGANFETLLQERLCQPLQMASTTCTKPAGEQRQRWAISHGQENRVVGDFVDAHLSLPGAGAIRSSANDMLRYLAANLGLTESPLTPLLENAQSVRTERAFGDAALALPWFVAHLAGGELLFHGGTTDGQKAFAGFDKRLKRGVVVLANRSDYSGQAVEPLGVYLLYPSQQPQPVKLAPKVLDSYAGLYESPQHSDAILAVRRDGDRLVTQLLNSAAREWVPKSKTEFVSPWSASQIRFSRSVTGRQQVAFEVGDKVEVRFRRIANSVPPSLFKPMFQPLSEDEYQLSSSSDLQGTWDAVLRPWFWPFYSLRLKAKIAEPIPGVFRAELDVPEHNANNQPLSVIYAAPNVQLIVRSGHGLFVGKLNRARTKMTGHWYQGPYSLGFSARRTPPKPDPAKKVVTR